MLIRAKWVIDRELRAIENGTIEVLNGLDVKLDFPESILMPGLVNAHCHLDYTDMRGLIRPKDHFTDWIRCINELKKSWTDNDYIRSISAGMRECVQFGTTFVVNWTCSPKWVAKPEPAGVVPRILWLWEQITLKETTGSSQWNEWREYIQTASLIWSAGLAPHAPYTCSTEVTREIAKWSEQNDCPWSIHVCESTDETQMFKSQSGKLFDLLTAIGRKMSDCTGRSPCNVVWSSLANPCDQNRVLLVHANYLDEDDFKKLEEVHSGMRIGVVHCPRSHAYFRRTDFPLRRFLDAGIPVSLGTDSLASNKNLSMFEEMRAFKATHPDVDSKTVLKMATTGSLEVLDGSESWKNWLDWLAIPMKSIKAEPFDFITSFTGAPHFIMINGRIIKNESI